MTDRQIGIIMHGVTGRMGMNQHLIRSILAIREQGGIVLSNGDRLMPDPLIVGRNPAKMERLAKAHGIARWSSDLDEALADPSCPIFFDAGTTHRLLSVRGEFGYWVFEGDLEAAQRPSWNYKAAEGGGIILDMLCHWRYVLDNLFGPVKAVSCLGATHIPERWDETGARYDADADDAAYASFELENGVIAQINSSWCVRVRRDDLVTFQADGVRGSAVAGLTRCWTQDRVNTPKPVWNPDEPQTLDFTAAWTEVPDRGPAENGFKRQWEMFLRHVVEDAPWRFGLLEGAKGVQLAELGLQSWRERRWLDVPALEL